MINDITFLTLLKRWAVSHQTEAHQGECLVWDSIWETVQVKLVSLKACLVQIPHCSSPSTDIAGVLDKQAMAL